MVKNTDGITNHPERQRAKPAEHADALKHLSSVIAVDPQVAPSQQVAK